MGSEAHCCGGGLSGIYLLTRGTFREVPTRRIRLSFVECAYSDLRDKFFFS